MTKGRLGDRQISIDVSRGAEHRSQKTKRKMDAPRFFHIFIFYAKDVICIKESPGSNHHIKVYHLQASMKLRLSAVYGHFLCLAFVDRTRVW
ncbi:hypothetical protein CPZ30_03790 [Paenibacillus lautus]|nr:hypothetical protein CPZ30_03790 [Paenibacillus lautus]